MGVGSGIIFDIIWYIVYKFKVLFVLFLIVFLMDGFVFFVAVFIINNLKIIILVFFLKVIFVDMEVIKSLFKILKKVGFGDLMRKIIVFFDWQFLNYIFDEMINMEVL